jgi:hypothetical protein
MFIQNAEECMNRMKRIKTNRKVNCKCTSPQQVFILLFVLGLTNVDGRGELGYTNKFGAILNKPV